MPNNRFAYHHVVNLPSPCVDDADPLGLYDDQFAPLRGNGPMEGLLTPLFQYQRATIMRMLHQELYPPGYVPTLGELPPDTYPPEFRSRPVACPYNCGKHHYSPAVSPLPYTDFPDSRNVTVRMRGGILAEDSRTGKTLECLALILLTKHQPACPTALDMPFTKVSCCLTYHHYLKCTLFPPYHYHGRHTNRAKKIKNGNTFSRTSTAGGPATGKMNTKVPPCLPRNGIVPPLRYLALRKIGHFPELIGAARESKLSPDLKELLHRTGPIYIQDREFSAACLENPKNVSPENTLHHREDIVVFTRDTFDIHKFKDVLESALSQVPSAWQRLTRTNLGYFGNRDTLPIQPAYPSRATLVIVSGYSMNFWVSEIKKHTVPGALKFKVVSKDSKPSIASLLECDLVLINYSYLVRAYVKSFRLDRDNKSWIRKHFPDLASSQSQPGCVRLNAKGLSPIYQILWKRVIVNDSVLTRGCDYRARTECIQNLQSERRWISLAPESFLLDSAEQCTSSARFPYPDYGNIPVTITSDQLGRYFDSILKVPPFNVDHIWDQLVPKREGAWIYRNDGPPLPGLLSWLLTTYVVRNRTEDVHNEVPLPPCTKRTIRLDCGFYEFHYYNYYLAQVIVYLKLTAPRINQAFFRDHLDRSEYMPQRRCLWPTTSWYASRGFLMDRVPDYLEEALGNPEDFGLSPTDIELLQLCERWINVCTNSRPPHVFQYNRGVQYYVDHWPVYFPFPWRPHGAKAIDIRALSTNLAVGQKPEVSDFHPPSLTTTRVIPLDASEFIEFKGRLRLQYNRVTADMSRFNALLNKQVGVDSSRVAADDSPPTNTQLDALPFNWAASSVMEAIYIRGCSSAKLTYLANQIHRQSDDEKNVVFVNSKEDFNEVTTFLTAMSVYSVSWPSIGRVHFPPYHGDWGGVDMDGVSNDKINEFNTNPGCRVLVMPTWMATLGVDLTAASRVYFFSPVWHDSIESQAIKRVHHVGRKRPVHVETLVLKNTLEDTGLYFKDKPYQPVSSRPHWLGEVDDEIIYDLAKLPPPIWVEPTAKGDLSNSDRDESSNQETPGTVGTADVTSSARPPPQDNKPQAVPEPFFDKPILVLSFQP